MPRPPFVLAPLLIALPTAVLAVGGLEPVAPMPPLGALVDTATFAVRLRGPCSLDPATLEVAVAGRPIPPADLLPLSDCHDGQRTTRTATIPLERPDGAITSAPAEVAAGADVMLAGSGDGDTLGWTFDGGAAPATGSPVRARFAAAGTYGVELRATRTLLLEARARAGGAQLRLTRPIVIADPTPDRRTVAVTIAPDVDFSNFEPSHVHPLALSADRQRLYAVDTPGARVTVFAVEANVTLSHTDSIPVGLEPVGLALHPDGRSLWVVNHLSDSVSVVDLDAGVVRATLDAGDEPTDVAFAAGRAFVSVQGEDRIAVFDAADLTPLARLDIFADGPRALAVSEDGTTVYAAALHSGNRTTIMSPSGFGVPNPQPPDPPRAPNLPPNAPFAGTIVRFNPVTGAWEDEYGIDRGFPVVDCRSSSPTSTCS